MKFKDIKKGDVVYVENLFHYGWGNRRDFWIPVEVERTTPKQFMAGSGRYRKEDGRSISSESFHRFARNLGEDCGFKEKVTDQTEEMQSFLNEIKMAHQIRSVSGGLRLFGRDDKNLAEIHKLTVKIEELLKK